MADTIVLSLHCPIVSAIALRGQLGWEYGLDLGPQVREATPVIHLSDTPWNPASILYVFLTGPHLQGCLTSSLAVNPHAAHGRILGEGPYPCCVPLHEGGTWAELSHDIAPSASMWGSICRGVRGPQSLWSNFLLLAGVTCREWVTSMVVTACVFGRNFIL